jgi:hypothetical protein
MNPFRVNPMITLIDENMEIDQEIDKMIMVLESQKMQVLQQNQHLKQKKKLLTREQKNLKKKTCKLKEKPHSTHTESI